jgi:hypothetical protein
MHDTFWFARRVGEVREVVTGLDCKGKRRLSDVKLYIELVLAAYRHKLVPKEYKQLRAAQTSDSLRFIRPS